MSPRRLRLGMVGGGRGAFIGAAHRIAARLDDRYTLVAGAFSADAENAVLSGQDAQLAPDRIYTDYREMAAAEARRADGVEVVSVVTPNHLHHPVCSIFLENGIDVICDKPLASTVADARDLVETVRRSGRFLGVTYTYSGYPMMREARALVEAGRIGAVRIVQVEFALGWLSGAVDDENKQARWRTDPAQAGPSLVVGDLGTHCLHLMEFVSGRRLARLAADVQTLVPGRRVDDNAQITLAFDNGARGAMWASVVAAGETVGLRLRVYGDRGHLAWDEVRPEELHLSLIGEGKRTLVRGGDGLSGAAKRATRACPRATTRRSPTSIGTMRKSCCLVRPAGRPMPWLSWRPALRAALAASPSSMPSLRRAIATAPGSTSTPPPPEAAAAPNPRRR